MGLTVKSLLMIAGVLVFACGLGCAIACSIVVSKMVEEINNLAPPAERESILFNYPGKVNRILRKHRALYPQSAQGESLRRLILVSVGLFLVGIALILVPPNL